MLEVFALLFSCLPGLEGSSFVAVFITLKVKTDTEQNQRNACFGKVEGEFRTA